MRTETIERTLYEFEELDDAAKEKARDWWREGFGMDDWWECTYEDAATIAALFGLDIRTKLVKLMNGSTRYDPAIYFSGFASQGDGACFEGVYSYKPGGLAAVKEYAPEDTKLHGIVKALQDAQRRAFYKLCARTRQSGHYMHSGCMSVSVKRDGYEVDGDDLVQALREFADWIYSQLETEYHYRTSDENVDENLSMNGYEFTSDGKIA